MNDSVMIIVSSQNRLAPLSLGGGGGGGGGVYKPDTTTTIHTHTLSATRPCQTRTRWLNRYTCAGPMDDSPFLQIMTSLGGNFGTQSTLARTELTQRHIFSHSGSNFLMES